MANIIIGPQIVNGIIRFKMHGEHFIYIVIFKGSFITVNIIRLLLIDHLGILVEHGWMDDVIVVKQAYIFPGGHGQAPVRISGYPFVFFQLLIDNPFFSSGASFILFLIFQTDLPHIIMGIVGAIRQTEFPIPVSLVYHRIQHGRQEFLGRIIKGH